MVIKAAENNKSTSKYRFKQYKLHIHQILVTKITVPLAGWLAFLHPRFEPRWELFNF